MGGHEKKSRLTGVDPNTGGKKGFPAIPIDSTDELIIVSGYKVCPTQVENVLCQHPGILEAAVLGTPDDHQGQLVHAVIKLKPGEKASEEELIKFCKKILAPYEVPRTIKFVEDFPRTGAGKILKQELHINWDNVYDNDFFIQHP